MNRYSRILSELRAARADAEGEELALLHEATARIVRAQSWAQEPPVSALSGTGLPPGRPPADGDGG